VQALLYAELTKKTLSDALTGGAFSWPVLIQGDTLTLGFRWTQRQNGQPVEVQRTLTSLRASIGPRDARPMRGQTRIQIGNPATTPTEGTNLTTPLGYNVSAADLQTALNALSSKPGAALVTEDQGTYLVSFSGATSHTVFTLRNNRLAPLSIVVVDQWQEDGEYISALRFKQLPGAFVDAFESVLPPPPVVSQLQAGFEDAGTTVSEVQKLYRPPTFRGTYVLKRAGLESPPLTEASDLAALEEALAAIIDPDGEFTAQDLAGQNASLIIFGGSMAGINQPLIEVEVKDSPPGDATLTLNLGTGNMAAYLRGAKDGQIKLPIEIEARFENEADDSKTDVITFDGEVTVRSEITLTQLASPANIDFIRPPSPVNYKAQGTGQIANGVFHFSDPLGDGTSTVFARDHDLASEMVFPVVRQNNANGEVLRLGVDYTVNLTNANSLTVTMMGDYLATPPDTDELLLYVLGFAVASLYDPHTHSIAEIDGLAAQLAAQGAAIATLQALVPSGSLGSSTQISTAPTLSVTLPLFVEAYPAINPDLSSEDADYKSLAEIPKEALPINGGLLPAVHDAAVEVLPTPVPNAADSYRNRVFRNPSPTASVELDGGFGRRGVTLRPGEFAACDGRSWYPVKRYDVSSTTTPKVFTVTTGTDVCASTAHGFSNGDAVLVSSDTTLPAPLAPEVTYYIRDVTTDSFKLAAASGVAAIDITTAGTGVHSIIAAPKTTFYPVDFERELFIIPISSKQFRIKKTLTIQAGIETALVHLAGASPRGGDWRLRDQRSTAQWSIVMRWGTTTSESSPATTGANLKGISWNATPILEHRINLVQSPMVHTFGCRIRRTGESTFTTEEILYGLASASASSVASADLVIGAWLERFDTNDGVSDPRGLALLMGLARSNDEAETLGTLTLN
jgi:hypothetical protein